MSLIKPIGISTSAFDKSQAHTFYFNVSGGDQVVKNRLTIRNNTTNAVVYQATVVTYQFQHTVPANTLTNGVQYNFYFNTYNALDEISANSDALQFYCYAQPVITFTNAPSTHIINNAVYNFIITYAQTQGELLDYLVFKLYDSTDALLSTSSKMYSALTPPLTFNHTFEGFIDNTTYSVQVEAISTNGTLSYSEKYTFLADYVQPNIQNLNELSNDAENGRVQIQSNVILVEGEVDNILDNNLLINPYFADGTNGWNTTICTLTAENGVALMTTTREDPQIRQALAQVKSHEIYACATTKTIENYSYIRIFDGLTLAFSSYNTGSNNFEFLSVLKTTSSTSTLLRFDVVGSNLISSQVYIKNCVLLDLTAIFGAGNEPTKEQMDELFNPNFNSTPNGDYIYRSKITDGNEASYIQWDSWFTPLANDQITVEAENYAIELVGSKILTFDDGYSIPTDFQCQRWLSPIGDGVLEYLYKTGNETNRMVVELKSGIPSGESTVKNWFELYTEDNVLHTRSNYVNAMNRDTKFIVWFKKIGATYTLLLDVISYGSGTAISWLGTKTYPTSSTFGNIDSLFPFDTIKLKNGAYDNIDLTRDTSRAYSQNFPTFDYYTILNCNCSSLDAGNIALTLSQVSSIRIKRRQIGSFDWLTIKEIAVTDADSLKFTAYDCGVPTNETFEWAIVPVMSSGVEGDYIIASLTTCFNWCYLCDGTTSIKFYSNVNYGQIQSNVPQGILMPIGRQYPITLYNSDNNYDTGSFSGDVLGGNFLDSRQITRRDVQTQLGQYKAFINNKKAKYLKDWDGRIRVVETNEYNETPNLIASKSTISFNFVEKGKWDDQSDLEDNGLV